ncbi:hypothetical protein PsorP6_015144 [Peronosclerospora sorghi]|uniref:Uncharacterized protein n=1 Tax=Peronosclerospora sorghi TaxID=230839 RepID=A0ACC0VTT0_9STRA|nr:hypothetical protein PsorP6_015144 [Peronosclerospora sorghi]
MLSWKKEDDEDLEVRVGGCRTVVDLAKNHNSWALGIALRDRSLSEYCQRFGVLVAPGNGGLVFAGNIGLLAVADEGPEAVEGGVTVWMVDWSSFTIVSDLLIATTAFVHSLRLIITFGFPLSAFEQLLLTRFHDHGGKQLLLRDTIHWLESLI